MSYGKLIFSNVGGSSHGCHVENIGHFVYLISVKYSVYTISQYLYFVILCYIYIAISTLLSFDIII